MRYSIWLLLVFVLIIFSCEIGKEKEEEERFPEELVGYWLHSDSLWGIEIKPNGEMWTLYVEGSSGDLVPYTDIPNQLTAKKDSITIDWLECIYGNYQVFSTYEFSDEKLSFDQFYRPASYFDFPEPVSALFTKIEEANSVLIPNASYFVADIHVTAHGESPFVLTNPDYVASRWSYVQLHDDNELNIGLANYNLSCFNSLPSIKDISITVVDFNGSGLYDVETTRWLNTDFCDFNGDVGECFLAQSGQITITTFSEEQIAGHFFFSSDEVEVSNGSFNIYF